MVRSFTPLAVLVLVLGVLPSGASGAQPEDYIVVLRDSADTDTTTDRLERDGFESLHRYEHALKGFSAKLNANQVAKVKKDPDVVFVSLDRTVEAIGAIAPGDSAPTGVRRIAAADLGTAHAAANSAVAVIDTGIALGHPDLNALSGKNCVSRGKKPASAEDDNGHGTHVSGTIAAKNNGSGVVGVAPGTRLYAVKVLNSRGSGTWSQVICGIDWVTGNAAALGITVASLSLGGGGTSDNACGSTNADALHRAICNSVNAGVTYVVAAGNSNADLATSTPAAYPEVLTVTAMSDSDGLPGATGGAPTCRTGEADDRYATFSNYAVAAREQAHTIAGPGVCIRSTWLSGGYNTISGTSMATPHVSGSVALCLGSGGVAGPCTGLAPAQIIQKLRNDAQAAATLGTYGFAGDPAQPIAGRYYGHLVWDGAY